MSLLRPIHPKIREERVKLLAVGCQNSAIALSLGILVAPVVNPALRQSLALAVGVGLLVVALEVAAIWMMRYVVRQEMRHDGP